MRHTETRVHANRLRERDTHRERQRHTDMQRECDRCIHTKRERES